MPETSAFAVQNQDLLQHITNMWLQASDVWSEKRKETEKSFSYTVNGSWKWNDTLRGCFKSLISYFNNQNLSKSFFLD